MPGGRVDPDEDWLDALKRELAEETGLMSDVEPELAFQAAGERDGVPWESRAFLCAAVGELDPSDPHGDVSEARWFTPSQTLRLLAELDWYDEAPLRDWLIRRGVVQS